MNKRLSVTQIEILTELKEKGILKLTYNKKLSTTTVKALIKIGAVDYNDRFDSIVLTEMGKTFEPTK